MKIKMRFSGRVVYNELPVDSLGWTQPVFRMPHFVSMTTGIRMNASENITSDYHLICLDRDYWLGLCFISCDDESGRHPAN
jgi:hypothetical protein